MARESALVAVVTGGARGIGRAAALALARKGYAVALVDRLAAELRDTARAIEACGVACLPVENDVSDHAAVRAAGNSILARWGRVHVLVNNAGVAQPKTLLEITEAEWDQTIAVNLKGCFNWCKALAAPMLAAGGGRIVNISSVNANTGAGPNAVSKFAYCAAKAGILGLTRALARELAPTVIVNAVCPGAVDTEFTREHFRTRGLGILKNIPLGRLGTPEDIAEVILFLATAEPMYLTGEVIDADGGQWIN
jgi:3-oxoacyl-[acyl-carrier protein] reductase